MDDREAARLNKLAADQGNALAQVNLAVLYENGLGGLPKDDREAARLYRLAADQGNALAQVSLGVFYETGRGGLPKNDRRPPNRRKCRPSLWRRQTLGYESMGAAREGCPQACYRGLPASSVARDRLRLCD
jgi:TPR repeat protein